MANTRFERGQIIEGRYNGRPYRFQALKEGEEGSGSVYGPGMDLIANKKVFLKKYIDPAPRTVWLNAFIDYHRKLQERIRASRAAMQLVVGMDFFQDERNRFWQVVEYVDNSRDLKSYLESSDTTWEQRVKFAKVFMFAIKTLHEELKLAHGDLKPANLLLIPQGSNYSIKLIDFDRPVFLDEDDIPWAATEGFLGSPSYFSPEHIKRQRPTDKSDVFTCGIILYQLLAKEQHPFGNENVPADYSSNTAPMPHFYGSFGSEARDAEIAQVLHSMLDPDPSKRPTAAEVHNTLLEGAALPAVNTVEIVPNPFVQIPLSTTKSPKGAADIVFLIDATGSMGPCIRALTEHVHSLIHSLVAGNSETDVAPVPDWRARVVGYRNFKDCNVSEVVARHYRKIGGGGWLLDHPFTRDEAELHRQLDSLKAFGGGRDPRESLLDALMLVMRSGFLPKTQGDAPDAASAHQWRTNGVGRVVIVFTDAGYQPEMTYSHLNTRFEERTRYPFDLEGAGLDELQSDIESGFFKIYVFAPAMGDYDELSDLANVMIMRSEADGDGFMRTIENGSEFSHLIDDIVKGVSRSSSDFREMTME